MNENESVVSVPKKKTRGPKKGAYRKVCIKVYVSDGEFSRMAEEATKANYRRKGLNLFLQKPHGFAHERVANSKGIGKFLRDCCFPAWIKGEAERILKRKQLEKQAEELGLEVR